MATSQFKIYQSSDVGAPVLNGLTGSLLNVFNKCLVTGYTNHIPVGWLKPLSDLVDPYAGHGMFTMPSGSGLSLFLDDGGPGAQSGQEARAGGWESITTIDSGSVTGSNPFPTTAQLTMGGGVGSVVIRKSVAATNTIRNWIMFADSSSFYFYTQAEGTVAYTGFYFGDIYSFVATGSDAYRCIVIGRSGEGSPSATYEGTDRINSVNAVGASHFMARNYNGSGASITCGKHGDSCRNQDPSSYAYFRPLNQYPNGSDMGLYLTPLYINEANGTIRGKLRGQYYISHPNTSFSDGQQFSGSGDYAGKTFWIVRQSTNTFGVYCIETSNTLDTN